jgi:phosphotransferase system  glucose/maltose/N-acetylglucosamine-specific IIC component
MYRCSERLSVRTTAVAWTRMMRAVFDAVRNGNVDLQHLAQLYVIVALYTAQYSYLFYFVIDKCSLKTTAIEAAKF